MDTSSSMESFGRSPSTIAVTHAEFSVIDPLWLSRNAVSAASRPVLIRTSVCRGARQGRVDHPPVPVDVRLRDRVEVHRLAARRVHRDQPRRHVHRAQQRDHQVRVVAAHARAGQQGVGRAVDRIRRAGNVVQPGAHPRRHLLQQRRRVEVLAEFGGGETEELVGLGVAAGPQIGRQVDLGDRRGVAPGR